MLDWRHYARYWLGRAPDYQAAPAVALRVFFFASWLGSVVGLNHALAVRRWTLEGLATQAEWSVVLLGIVFLLDLAFRWQWGRPPPQ
jgi:hypothetical protein